jgi:hypothetical protein
MKRSKEEKKLYALPDRLSGLPGILLEIVGSCLSVRDRARSSRTCKLLHDIYMSQRPQLGLRIVLGMEEKRLMDMSDDQDDSPMKHFLDRMAPWAVTWIFQGDSSRSFNWQQRNISSRFLLRHQLGGFTRQMWNDFWVAATRLRWFEYATNLCSLPVLPPKNSHLEALETFILHMPEMSGEVAQDIEPESYAVQLCDMAVGAPNLRRLTVQLGHGREISGPSASALCAAHTRLTALDLGCEWTSTLPQEMLQKTPTLTTLRLTGGDEKKLYSDETDSTFPGVLRAMELALDTMKVDRRNNKFRALELQCTEYETIALSRSTSDDEKWDCSVYSRTDTTAAASVLPTLSKVFLHWGTHKIDMYGNDDHSKTPFTSAWNKDSLASDVTVDDVEISGTARIFHRDVFWVIDVSHRLNVQSFSWTGYDSWVIDWERANHRLSLEGEILSPLELDPPAISNSLRELHVAPIGTTAKTWLKELFEKKEHQWLALEFDCLSMENKKHEDYSSRGLLYPTSLYTPWQTLAGCVEALQYQQHLTSLNLSMHPLEWTDAVRALFSTHLRKLRKVELWILDPMAFAADDLDVFRGLELLNLFSFQRRPELKRNEKRADTRAAWTNAFLRLSTRNPELVTLQITLDTMQVESDVDFKYPFAGQKLEKIRIVHEERVIWWDELQQLHRGCPRLTNLWLIGHVDQDWNAPRLERKASNLVKEMDYPKIAAIVQTWRPFPRFQLQMAHRSIAVKELHKGAIFNLERLGQGFIDYELEHSFCTSAPIIGPTTSAMEAKQSTSARSSSSHRRSARSDKTAVDGWTQYQLKQDGCRVHRQASTETSKQVRTKRLADQLLFSLLSSPSLSSLRSVST